MCYQEMNKTLLFAIGLCLLPGLLRGAVLAGPVTNNATGNLYYLLAQSTWPSAEAEAIQLGGHLVTIDDASENNWVFSTFAGFGGQPRCLWIGYHRQQLHGSFSWASGSSST